MKLSIDWAGPHRVETVIEKLDDWGPPPRYEGEDYGLYQIYGRHILGGRDSLLYVGKVTEETFSARFREHDLWIKHEWAGVRVYVGRLYDPERHSRRDKWSCWKADVKLAEQIIIHKYSPHYNSSSISELPDLGGLRKVVLLHHGNRNRLRRRDVAPDDLK